MNEDMNRREAVVNEAALSGVGGGAGDSTQSWAAHLCGDCAARSLNGIPSNHCTGSEAKLAEYMRQRGPVYNWRNCPYFKRSK